MHICRLVLYFIAVLYCAKSFSASPTARDIIHDAIEQWRGQSSYFEMTMMIQREDWQRSMSMKGWTQGEKKSLIRVTGPKKDAGNGTLLDGKSMWSYSPKVNRVIKIPSSMMGQSWMGSDFSNRDISRADDLLYQYQHKLLKSEKKDGRTLYTIEAVPLEDAPVVWGREELIIRDDYIMLEHKFYDQDGVLVKTMKTLNIQDFHGRFVAQHQRMEKADTKGEWTEIIMQEAHYNIDIKGNTFTLSNLRNPRR